MLVIEGFFDTRSETNIYLNNMVKSLKVIKNLVYSLCLFSVIRTEECFVSINGGRSVLMTIVNSRQKV